MYVDVHLVRNMTIAIGWLTTSEHTWFDKHELRQIMNLIADLEHPYIFMAMLASTGEFNFCPILFVITLYCIDFT
jgi:hypothetical protein